MRRSLQSLSLLAALGFASLLAGAPPLTITDSGYFLTIVDDAGVPALERIETVVDMRTDGTPPVPEPPDKPDEPAPPPAGISADVAEWAGEVDQSKEAQRYALIFEAVRDAVGEGKVLPDGIFTVLKESTDGLISGDWTEFRQRLGDYLVDQAQRGNLGTKKQVVDMLERVRYGLAYSSTGGESITEEDAAEVISKVNAVIEGE